MQLTKQKSLFGKREFEHGQITVDNARLYPFVRTLLCVADESRIEWDGEKLNASVVDPANVHAVHTSLSADSDLEPITEGFNLKYLHGRIQNKPRTSNSVNVTLDIARPNGSIQIHEEKDGYTWDVSERLKFIDPDSIRQNPDMRDIETEAAALIPIKPLRSFVSDLRTTEPIELKTDGKTLRVGQIDGPGKYHSIAEFDGVYVENEAVSIFSYDYFKNIVETLHIIGVESVYVEWADEYPMFAYFMTDYGLEGMHMLAPRIMSE